MKTLLALPLFALVAGCTGYASPGPMEAAAIDDVARANIDRVLAGRVEEPTVPCVPARDIEGSTPLTSDLIMFRGRGNVVYLNQTRGACNFNPSSAYRRVTTSSSMCVGEIIDVYDPRTQTPRGSCALGEFTPFRRAG